MEILIPLREMDTRFNILHRKAVSSLASKVNGRDFGILFVECNEDWKAGLSDYYGLYCSQEALQNFVTMPMVGVSDARNDAMSALAFQLDRWIIELCQLFPGTCQRPSLYLMASGILMLDRGLTFPGVTKDEVARDLPTHSCVFTWPGSSNHEKIKLAADAVFTLERVFPSTSRRALPFRVSA